MIVTIKNLCTGETLVYKDAKLMVASNGTTFIKVKGQTVWASGSTDFVATAVYS